MKKGDHHAIDQYMEYGINYEDRIIQMDSDVDDESVGRAIKALQLLDKSPGKPITIVINSFGGSVYDGLALYDTIRACESEIITEGKGKIMSMATFIFLAGDKRHISKRSTFMVHEISDWAIGGMSDLQNQIKETKRLESILISIYCERTSMKERKHWSRMKKETYITPEDAIEKGMAHTIIGE